jgi:hypothetical protein
VSLQFVCEFLASSLRRLAIAQRVDVVVERDHVSLSVRRRIRRIGLVRVVECGRKMRAQSEI